MLHQRVLMNRFSGTLTVKQAKTITYSCLLAQDYIHCVSNFMPKETTLFKYILVLRPAESLKLVNFKGNTNISSD